MTGIYMERHSVNKGERDAPAVDNWRCLWSASLRGTQVHRQLGAASAAAHHALGVPAQTVLEDYLLTNEAIDYEGYVLPVLAPRLESGPLPDQETIMSLAGVRPEYLRAAFETIVTEFEGVERSIEDAIGLDAGKRERFRERLLD